MDFIGMIGGAVAGYFGNMASQAQADADNRLSIVNRDAKTLVRGAQNAFAAAKGSLNRWTQSVNNNRRLDAGGRALEDNMVNFQRNNDNMTARGFSDQIKMAEQIGQQAASAAAAGVSGGVVDMIDTTTALKHSIVNEQVKASGETAAFDAAHRAGSIAMETMQGLDGSIILDSLDYNREYAQKTAKIGSFGAAVRGAFPYARDMLGKINLSSSGSSDQTIGKQLDDLKLDGGKQTLAEAQAATETSWNFSYGADEKKEAEKLYGADGSLGYFGI